MARLSDSDLREMLLEARKRASRAAIEVEQIEEATEMVMTPPASAARKGPTRERILQYVRDHGPVAPKQVIAFMGGGEDDRVAPVVYNALSRMVSDGHLVREENGYMLASRQRSAEEASPIDALVKDAANIRARLRRDSVEQSDGLTRPRSRTKQRLSGS